MKATGIVRHIDELGRVVVPKEIRKRMGLREGASLECFMDEETGGVIFVPYKTGVIEEVKNLAEKVDIDADVTGHYKESLYFKRALLDLADEMEKSGVFDN